MNRIASSRSRVQFRSTGPSKPTLHVLLVHDSLDWCPGVSRLLATRVREKGASFIDATLSDPAYVRCESSCCGVQPHAEDRATDVQRAVFELRIYESSQCQGG